MSILRRFRLPARGRRREPEPGPRLGPEQTESFLRYQRRRQEMHEEASRLLDDRLDLAKDAAPWNVATFTTLAGSTLAAAATLALTGFTWLVAAPIAAAAVFFSWLALRSLRAARGEREPRSRRREEDEPPPSLR